jgi:hypothetical protein
MLHELVALRQFQMAELVAKFCCMTRGVASRGELRYSYLIANLSFG